MASSRSLRLGGFFCVGVLLASVSLASLPEGKASCRPAQAPRTGPHAAGCIRPPMRLTARERALIEELARLAGIGAPLSPTSAGARGLRRAATLLTWGGTVGRGPLGPMIDRYPGLRLASLGIPWGLLQGSVRSPTFDPPRGVTAAQLHGIVPVCTEENWQIRPAIYGDTIVWMDWRNPNGWDIYGWDPAKGEQAICTAPGNQGCSPGRNTYGLAIHGDTVVWQDERDYWSLGSDIYAWRPPDHEWPVCTGPDYQGMPAIYGDTIVWEDGRNCSTTPKGGWDIYAWDPAEGERRITDLDTASCPAICGDTVVWVDRSTPDRSGDIYAWEPLRGEWPVCTAPGNQHRPAIYGDRIVWEDSRDDPGDGSNSDIYAWDSVTRCEVAVCIEAGLQCNPAIHGNTVVWDHDFGAIYVSGWNPKTSGAQLVWESGSAVHPVIYGSTIVWEDRLNSTTGWDIYAYFGWCAALPGDINADGKVDETDLNVFFLGWLQARQPQPTVDARCDLDGDGKITATDAKAFLEQWLSSQAGQ